LKKCYKCDKNTRKNKVLFIIDFRYIENSIIVWNATNSWSNRKEIESYSRSKGCKGKWIKSNRSSNKRNINLSNVNNYLIFRISKKTHNVLKESYHLYIVMPRNKYCSKIKDQLGRLKK